MSSLSTLGYEIIQNPFSLSQIEKLRSEADRIASQSNSACVRHIRAKSSLFHEFALAPEITNLFQKEKSPVRSILFDKTPEQNWPVAWHQDLTIAVSEEKKTTQYGPWSFKDGSPHVQPPVDLLQEMTTIRIHLDDTPAHNGALQVIPKSHLLGKIPSDQVKQHIHNQQVTCECQSGDILLMSPLILHSSLRSKHPKRRRVLHFEYAPRELLSPDLQWFES